MITRKWLKNHCAFDAAERMRLGKVIIDFGLSLIE